MEMMQKMTKLFNDISARGYAFDVPYSRIAEKNLVYSIGKQLQVLSNDNGVIEGSSSQTITVSINKHPFFSQKLFSLWLSKSCVNFFTTSSTWTWNSFCFFLSLFLFVYPP